MSYQPPHPAFPASPKTPCPCSARSSCSEAGGDVYSKTQPGRLVMPFARWSAEGAQWKPSANPPDDIFCQGWGQESGKGTAGHRDAWLWEALEIRAIWLCWSESALLVWSFFQDEMQYDSFILYWRKVFSFPVGKKDKTGTEQLNVSGDLIRGFF